MIKFEEKMIVVRTAQCEKETNTVLKLHRSMITTLMSCLIFTIIEISIESIIVQWKFLVSFLDNLRSFLIEAFFVVSFLLSTPSTFFSSVSFKRKVEPNYREIRRMITETKPSVSLRSGILFSKVQ